MTSCDAITKPDRAVDRDMQRIDFGLAAGMLDLPHPLLGDDKHRQFVGRRAIDLEIDDGAPDEQAEEAKQEAAVQLTSQCQLLRGPIAAIDRIGGAIANAKQRQQEEQQSEDERRWRDSSPANSKSTSPPWGETPACQKGIHARHISRSAFRVWSAASWRRPSRQAAFATESPSRGSTGMRTMPSAAVRPAIAVRELRFARAQTLQIFSVA